MIGDHLFGRSKIHDRPWRPREVGGALVTFMRGVAAVEHPGSDLGTANGLQTPHVPQVLQPDQAMAGGPVDPGLRAHTSSMAARPQARKLPGMAVRDVATQERRRRARRVGEDRILSLPNVVTTIRLVLVPAFVWLLVQPHRRDWFAAAVLLAALGSTDWVDGQLARRLDQVTTVGKVLDPTADRVLLATAAIGILAVGAVPTPIAVIALTREGLVALAAVGLAVAGVRRIDVTLVGKAGAFGLMCAFPFFLAGHSTVGWHQTALALGWIAAVIGLVLGWFSVLFYVPLVRAALVR